MGTKGCLVLVTRLDFLEPFFFIGEILSNFSISRLNPPFHGGSNDRAEGAFSMRWLHVLGILGRVLPGHRVGLFQELYARLGMLDWSGRCRFVISIVPSVDRV